MQREIHSLRKSVRIFALAMLAGCGGGSDSGQSNSQASSGAAGAASGSLTASAAVLPSNGVRAVPTFESISLYWTPSANPGAGCPVIFRKVGDSTWRQGLDTWYDPRNGECRGSLVLLEPGTSYEIQLGMPGQTASSGLITTTWSEQFPIAQAITVGSQSTTLNVTQSGTPNGYVLYQAAPGAVIDVGTSQSVAISIASCAASPSRAGSTAS